MSVELSGLPIFDRDRSFKGYRGFGVCRDVARATSTPPLSPKETERPLLTVVPAAKNVVPFRTAAPEKRPTLTPVERSAFHEIAEALGKGEAPPIAPEPAPLAGAPEPVAQEPAPPPREPEPEEQSPEPMPSAFAVGATTDAAPKQADAQLAILERLRSACWCTERTAHLRQPRVPRVDRYGDLAPSPARAGWNASWSIRSRRARTASTAGQDLHDATRTGDTPPAGPFYSVP